jgi:hypothetical protein
VTTPPVILRRQVSTAVSLAVRDRDEDRCTSCGTLIVGALHKHWTVWKRIPKPPHDAEPDPRVCETSNLLTVCGYSSGCHRWLRRDEEAARRRGFLLWRDQAPLAVPVLVWSGPGLGAIQLASRVTPYLLDDLGRRMPFTGSTSPAGLVDLRRTSSV